MAQKTAQYAFKVRLDLPYEQALERVAQALKDEGVGVLTRIDMKETLKEKLNADFREYAILGACNPPLAHRALTADLDAGLLLPCNVVVYEEDGGSEVGIMDPISMLGLIATPELEPVAQEARARLERVAKALSG